jgi:hypothetical protein
VAGNRVRVILDADARGFEQGFDRATTKSVAFGAAIGTFAANVALNLGQKALSAVKDFVGDSVNAFSNLKESLNALEVVYGDNADGIKKLGEASAQSLGVSNSEFNNYAVSISAFAKQIAGEGGDVVGTVDILSKRVADFASVMNLDFGEAAEKFQSGLAGQSRPLREFGIDVSDARVKQQALADGIWNGVGAMTENQKVQGRYNAIMAQTAQVTGDFARTSGDAANKTRILEAELENQKAALGKGLMPLYNQWLDVQGSLLPVMADLAIGIAQLTGAISDGEAMLAKWEQRNQQSIETAKDFVKAALEMRREANTPWGVSMTREWMDSFKEAIRMADLAPAEFAKIRAEIKQMRHDGKLTAEQTKELTAAWMDQSKVLAAQNHPRNRQAISDAQALEGAMGSLGDEVEDTTEEVESQTDALRRLHSETKGMIDPAFKYMEAQQKLAGAQERYNAAVKEFGKNSPQAIDAAKDIADANMDIHQAVVAIAEDGVPAAMKALKSMGVPPEVIKKFGEDKRRIEEIFRNLVLRIGVTAPTLTAKPSSGGVGWESKSKTYYQRGGIVTEGFLDGNRSNRKEAVLPLDTHYGKQALAAAIAEALGSMNGGSSNGGRRIELANGSMDAGELVSALIDWQRRNGPLPFKVA